MASLTKALMTEMPEKLSWEKSLSLEKASWRMSHFFVMNLPMSTLHASSSTMGIMARLVMSLSICHMRQMAIPPSASASNIMSRPLP